MDRVFTTGTVHATFLHVFFYTYLLRSREVAKTRQQLAIITREATTFSWAASAALSQGWRSSFCECHQQRDPGEDGGLHEDVVGHRGEGAAERQQGRRERRRRGGEATVGNGPVGGAQQAVLQENLLAQCQLYGFQEFLSSSVTFNLVINNQCYERCNCQFIMESWTLTALRYSLSCSTVMTLVASGASPVGEKYSPFGSRFHQWP